MHKIQEVRNDGADTVVCLSLVSGIPIKFQILVLNVGPLDGKAAEKDGVLQVLDRISGSPMKQVVGRHSIGIHEPSIAGRPTAREIGNNEAIVSRSKGS
jgi:hypothetical protein